MCNQCWNFTWSWVPLASGFVQQNYLFTTFWKLPLPPPFPIQVTFTFWCDFAIHNSFFGGINKKPFMTKIDQFALQLLCSSNHICGNIIVVGIFIYRKLFSSGSRIFVGAFILWGWNTATSDWEAQFSFSLSPSKHVFTKNHFVPNRSPWPGEAFYCVHTSNDTSNAFLALETFCAAFLPPLDVWLS